MRNINPEGKPVARCIFVTDDLILLGRRIGNKGHGVAIRGFLRIVGSQLDEHILNFIEVYPLSLMGMRGGRLISPVLDVDLYRFYTHGDQCRNRTTH